jgi:muramoyltetrapeptide carboxypeptidase
MALNPLTTRVNPPALELGDTIGIIAPASDIQRDLLAAGCNRLRELGYKTFYFDSIFERDLYFAGSVARRARELEAMFMQPEIGAVVCARGGYGTNYLLDAIDIQTIKAHPKILMGYSDVTTLLTWFADAAGIVTFHGPMVTKDFSRPDGVDLFSWEAAVTGSAKWTIAGQNVESLVEGAAEGILYGGCLSMLVASLGTPYEICTAGTILFLEDIAAKPFQIDRMLMHLKLAGKLEGVRGIVFGEMLECVQSSNQPYTLQEVVLRVVGNLGIPVAFGLRSGHVSRENVTLPIGVRVALEVTKSNVSLRILESATVAEGAGTSARG